MAYLLHFFFFLYAIDISINLIVIVNGAVYDIAEESLGHKTDAHALSISYKPGT